jgi:hypothetical protein
MTKAYEYLSYFSIISNYGDIFVKKVSKRIGEEVGFGRFFITFLVKSRAIL